MSSSESENSEEIPKKSKKSTELAKSKKPSAPKKESSSKATEKKPAAKAPGIAIIKPKAKIVNAERAKLEEKIERASKLLVEQKEGLSIVSEDLLSRLPAYEITGIFAGVADPKYIKKSATPNGISKPFDEGKTDRDFTNTIFDKGMGASDLYALCGTCKMPKDGPTPCPGHNGHIKLASRVYNLAYFPELLNILNCFCRDCGTLLISPAIIQREPRFNNALGLTKLKRISEESVKYSCKECKTKKYNNPIDMAKSRTTFKVQIKKGADDWEIMPIDTVYNLLKNVSDGIPDHTSDDVYRLLGYPLIRDSVTKIPITTHPKNYVTRYIIVIPPYMRPNNYTKKEAELSPESKLYDNLVKMNITIDTLKKKLEANPKNNTVTLELERIVDNMTQYVASLLDSEKYGARIMHGIPMKGVRQRIQGKEADIRAKIEGKVAEFVSRQPIGPDPTVEFGQARMPISLMRDQTIPEKVFGGNKVELTKLLRLGKVLAIVPGSGPKKGLRVPVTEDNKNTISLEIGDEVHRRMKNGDVVLNNRYPSIQMYSILGATALAGFQENLGIHMAVTKAYNADFDGDEMQTHIPQTTGAIADIYASVHARRNMINAQSSRPLFGGVYDVPVATTLLSNPDTVVSEIHFFNVITRLKKIEQLFTLFPRIQRFGKKISRQLIPVEAIAPILEIYNNFIVEEEARFIESSLAEEAFMKWLKSKDLLLPPPANTIKLERYRRNENGKLDPLFISSNFGLIANLVKGSSTQWERFETLSKDNSLPYTFLKYEDAYYKGENNSYIAYLSYLDYRRKNKDISYGRYLKEIFPRTDISFIKKKLSLEDFINDVAPKYNDPDSIFKLFITDSLKVLPKNTPGIPDLAVTSDAATTAAVIAVFRRTYPQAEIEDNDILEQLIRFIGEPVPIKEFAREMRGRLETQLEDYMVFVKTKRRKSAEKPDKEEAAEIKENADKMELRARDNVNKALKELDELEAANPNEKVWLNYYLNNIQTKSQQEYYGTTLLSAILPAGLEYNEYGVIIKAGVVLSGIWTMDVVGTSHNSLIQAVWDQYGSDRASDFITDLYFMSNYIYTQLGMTLSPSDLIIDNPKELLKIERQRTQLYEKFNALTDAFPENTDDPILKDKYEREVLELTKDFSNLGISVVKLLGEYANLSIIAQSKAKGKASNFAQMIVDLQQQMLYGERLKPTLRGNTVSLPYFTPNERSLASQGFIATPYMRGLSPAEFFQHAMANRQGIVDMQTKTQDVGDDHRRLVKTMEDVFIEEDGSVRNRASGAIIQMVWGYHGFTPTQLRLFNTPTGKVAGPIYPVELVNRINSFYS
jgi:DNA-directed RNA polymerase beta' subunit